MEAYVIWLMSKVIWRHQTFTTLCTQYLKLEMMDTFIPIVWVGHIGKVNPIVFGGDQRSLEVPRGQTLKN